MTFIYSPQLQNIASTQITGTVRFIEMLDGMRAVRHILSPVLLEVLPFQLSSGTIALQTPTPFQSYGAAASFGPIDIPNTNYFLHLAYFVAGLYVEVHRADTSLFTSTNILSNFPNGIIAENYMGFHLKANTYIYLEWNDGTDGS